MTLVKAQLQGTSLNRAQMQGASLVNTELQGASLNGAQLQGAEFDGTRLDYGDLPGSLVWRSSRQQIMLVGADLAGLSPDPVRTSQTHHYSTASTTR